MQVFGGWASDTPIFFELEAHKSLGQCLDSILKIKKNKAIISLI